MKIIKEGQLPGKALCRGTCNNCRTQIECQKDEVEWHFAPYQRDEDYGTIKCPPHGCPAQINVYEVKMRSHEPDSQFGKGTPWDH